MLAGQDVEHAVHHLDLHAELEPLVVEVESDAGFQVKVVLFELDNLLPQALLLPFFGLGGQVESVLDARHHERPEIVVPQGSVPHLDREIDVGGWHALGNGDQARVAVAIGDDLVNQIPVAEGQGGDKPNVKVFSDPEIADDADDKPRGRVVFNVQDPCRIGHGQDVGDVGGVPDPEREVIHRPDG